MPPEQHDEAASDPPSGDDHGGVKVRSTLYIYIVYISYRCKVLGTGLTLIKPTRRRRSGARISRRTRSRRGRRGPTGGSRRGRRTRSRRGRKGPIRGSRRRRTRRGQRGPTRGARRGAQGGRRKGGTKEQSRPGKQR